MKDIVFELDGNEYYVLEEIHQQNKNFILCVNCNLKQDKIDENQLILMEYKEENGNQEIVPITDRKFAQKIIFNILKKMRK